MKTTIFDPAFAPAATSYRAGWILEDGAVRFSMKSRCVYETWRRFKTAKGHAERFYAIHREKAFYDSLTDFMSSGPSIVMVLEKDNAIEDLRTLIGATNFEDAEEGTLRKDFASSIEANAIHGSDSPESAAIEIPFFFTTLQLRG